MAKAPDKRALIPDGVVINGSDIPDTSDFELEDFLTFRLLVLARALDRQAKRVYGESFGLSLVEWRIIAVIGTAESGTVNALAQRMDYDKAQISRAIASLVEQGYLERATNAADTRSAILTLSARGKELHHEIIAFGRERQRTLLTALSPAQRRSLYEIMDVLTEHLRKEDAKVREPRPMSTVIKAILAAAGIAATLAVTPAQAQKSKDTLRLAFLEATQSTDPYLHPKPENNFLTEGISDTIVFYDEENHRYVPLLAQVGQGAITYHSDEHLAASDRGIRMLRKLMSEQIELVQKGGDPQGVTFDPAKAVNEVRAGNFFRD